MEVSKPITLDPVSVVILQQSFVISSVVQEILKQIIFVLREKADKVHRWKHKPNAYTAPKFLGSRLMIFFLIIKGNIRPPCRVVSLCFF